MRLPLPAAPRPPHKSAKTEAALPSNIDQVHCSPTGQLKKKARATVLAERIERRIFVLRGQKVMLRTDLALPYDVEPRALVQAVKRNVERFPADFIFQLDDEEFRSLKSQIVTSSWMRSPCYSLCFHHRTSHECRKAFFGIKCQTADAARTLRPRNRMSCGRAHNAESSSLLDFSGQRERCYWVAVFVP
ncbi:MAG: ORF6N domain-containing protein [Candidatus Binataceae bacterium]|nr:ORF6N domain-containing protein [Candidatus Binataceae bacterium]